MSKREPSEFVFGVDCYDEDIVCPHCLEVDEERTDYPSSLQRDGDSVEVECSECEEAFKVTMCVEYTFKSAKPSAAEGEG